MLLLLKPIRQWTMGASFLAVDPCNGLTQALTRQVIGRAWWVVEGRCGFGFEDEALAGVVVAGQLGWEQFGRLLVFVIRFERDAIRNPADLDGDGELGLTVVK